MKKFLVRILCCFIPSRKKRHEIWANFKQNNHDITYKTRIKTIEKQIIEIREKQNHMLWELRNALWHDNARLIAAAELHKKSFAGYRNKFAGKTVVLVGAGPSLNKFKPIKNAIYVGLNRAFLFDKVKFDYLFTIDKAGIDKIYDKFIEYDCTKFVGDQDLGPMFQIPESVINKIPNVFRYKTDAIFAPKFALDIEYEPLGNFNTVSLQAMQFILYTNPAKIYLVGIDCSAAGHFTDNTKNHIEEFDISKRGENINIWADISIQFWKQLKEFADTYYPETDIISVNPVGLKGLFKDLNQEDK